MESKRNPKFNNESDDEASIPIVSSKAGREYFNNEEGEDLISEFYNNLKINQALEYDFHEDDKNEPFDPNAPIEVDSDNDYISFDNDEQDENQYDEDQFENDQEDENYEDPLQEEIDNEIGKVEQDSEENDKAEPVIFNNLFKERKKTSFDVDDILQPCPNPKYSVLK